MQITETKNEKLLREYHVNVAYDLYAKKMSEQLESLRQKVNTPGFRPGKTPLNIVAKMYKEKVEAEVLHEVVNQAIDELVRANNLRIATNPEVDIDDVQENKDIKIKLSFEVFPEITLPDFSKIKLDKPVADIPVEDVDKALNQLAMKSAEKVKDESGKKAEHGDILVIDFKGSIDGVAFDGGAGKDYKLTLGSKTFIEGFENQLVGAKAGDEIAVNVQFPAAYHASELAGKDAVFDVEVKEILCPKTAEINDEFAKTHNFHDLQALKQKIEEVLTANFDDLANNTMRKALFDQLEKLCKFELPNGMVKDEFNKLWSRIEDEAKQYNTAIADSEEELTKVRATYTKIAERRVMLGLLLAEIGKVNNINISQGDIQRAVYAEARKYPGYESQFVEAYRNNQAMLNGLRASLLEDKVVELLFGMVALNEVKMTSKQLEETHRAEQDQFVKEMA
jgi:trigger factor